jgi:predicted GNAT family acetyltransferase/predicted GIY-YIG superfamily endonuclease
MRTDRKGYLYVIHFDEPIHHARHYCGCTTVPLGRLAQHAIGRGSRLTQVAKERGIGWELGGLATCTLTELRRLERRMKDWHGSGPFCEICSGFGQKRVGETTPMALDLWPVSRRSEGLALHAQPWLLEVRHARPDEPREHMDAVERIMGYDRANLGFIPVGGSGGLEYSRQAGRLVLAFAGDQGVAGYLAYTVGRSKGSGVHIQQTCTTDAYRGSGIGRAMVEHVSQTWQDEHLTAWVRSDLAACLFWEAIGFREVERKEHRTSGSTLVKYQRNSAT